MMAFERHGLRFVFLGMSMVDIAIPSSECGTYCCLPEKCHKSTHTPFQKTVLDIVAAEGCKDSEKRKTLIGKGVHRGEALTTAHRRAKKELQPTVSLVTVSLSTLLVDRNRNESRKHH